MVLAAVVCAGCEARESAGSVDRCALGVVAQLGDGTPQEKLEAFEDLIGRPVDIDRRYYWLEDEVPGEEEAESSDRGRLPLFSINGRLQSGDALTFAEMADPDHPVAAPLVSALAARIRDFERPVLIVIEEQPDDSGRGTPAEFVAAWRQIVSVARAEGADNAQWVWSLATRSFPSDADDWYPGDEWVDWLGAVGYNWYTGDPVSPWRIFPSIFAPFREWAQPHGKPLVITSMASAEHPQVPDDDPRSKATWIREMQATLEDWPEMQAIVWFHDVGPDEIRDWRVDSSAASLEAFRDLAASPHMDITGQSPPASR